MSAAQATSLWQFFALVAATWLALGGLLALAAYRRYTFHLVPFIATFAILARLALNVLGLHEFAWWYLAHCALGLLVGLILHVGSAGGLRALDKLRRQLLGSIPEGDLKRQVARELAPRRATLQDAIVDVVVCALVFLAASWLFGRIR